MTKQHFKFRHVNEMTGTFVIFVLVVLIGAVVWTARSQQWFRGTVKLEIALPEAGAAGIRRGSDVYFLGTLVGTVSHVVVDTTGRMTASIPIQSDFFRFVRKDSYAVIKKKFGVAGDAYFEITRGQGEPLPRKGASILCKQLPGTVEAAIEEVRRMVLPVLDKLSAGFDTWTTLGEKLSAGADAWTTLGTNLGESRQHWDQLIGHIDGLVSGVAQGNGIAGKLLTDPALAQDLQTILSQGSTSMDQFQAILRDVQATATHLSSVSQALVTEANDLPGLVLQSQQMLYELERLIEGIQQHWLIRKYMEQRAPNTRISPSEVTP